MLFNGMLGYDFKLWTTYRVTKWEAFVKTDTAMNLVYKQTKSEAWIGYNLKALLISYRETNALCPKLASNLRA